MSWNYQGKIRFTIMYLHTYFLISMRMIFSNDKAFHLKSDTLCIGKVTLYSRWKRPFARMEKAFCKLYIGVDTQSSLTAKITNRTLHFQQLLRASLKLATIFGYYFWKLQSLDAHPSPNDNLSSCLPYADQE